MHLLHILHDVCAQSNLLQQHSRFFNIIVVAAQCCTDEEFLLYDVYNATALCCSLRLGLFSSSVTLSLCPPVTLPHSLKLDKMSVVYVVFQMVNKMSQSKSSLILDRQEHCLSRNTGLLKTLCQHCIKRRF